MKLFVKTLSKQAECRKYCLFSLRLNQRLQRGQTGMITGHLCLLRGELRTSVPMPRCHHSPPTCTCVCLCVRVPPITLPAAGIPGIKESSGRWPEDEGGWWVGGCRASRWSGSCVSPSPPLVVQVKAPNCTQAHPPLPSIPSLYFQSREGQR